MLALVATLAALSSTDEVDCRSMKTKALRQWLAARGLKCDGCAEKSDFVALCEANHDAPLVKPKADPHTIRTPGDGGKKDNIEDLLAGLKGMPGMENLKMFTPDDLKNMDPEKMAGAFGGNDYKPPKRTRDEYRRDVVDFYTRFGLEDKIEGVDAALDKWKGREEKMLSALYKKYDKEVQAFYDKELENDSKSATKEEL